MAKKQNQFVEWVSVSSKGQIAIPKQIRKLLDIHSGDRLLIILRKNHDGLNLIKKDSLDKIFKKLNTN